jgi:hypothetical protein
VVTHAFEHPAWCDPSECDAESGTGRGYHRARPMAVPYHNQSRSSASVLMFNSPGEAQTWICMEVHTVDVHGDPAGYSQLLAPEQARILGRHLQRAGQEAVDRS